MELKGVEQEFAIDISLEYQNSLPFGSQVTTTLELAIFVIHYY